MGDADKIFRLITSREARRSEYNIALEDLHLHFRDKASRSQIKRAVAKCDERRDRLVDAAAAVQRAKAEAWKAAHSDTGGTCTPFQPDPTRIGPERGGV